MTLKYTAFRSRARVREHDLVAERRLAAARAAGDQVERELRDPAAQHVVEARARRRAVCESERGRSHVSVSVGALSSIVGQALRSTWTVSRSPMKVVMSSRKVPNRAAAASAAAAGSSACRARAELRQPSGRCTSARKRELGLRQLRAAGEQRLQRR